MGRRVGPSPARRPPPSVWEGRERIPPLPLAPEKCSGPPVPTASRGRPSMAAPPSPPSHTPPPFPGLQLVAECAESWLSAGASLPPSSPSPPLLLSATTKALSLGRGGLRCHCVTARDGCAWQGGGGGKVLPLPPQRSPPPVADGPTHFFLWSPHSHRGCPPASRPFLPPPPSSPSSLPSDLRFFLFGPPPLRGRRCAVDGRGHHATLRR